MLKWELMLEGNVRDMDEDNQHTEPSQGAYYFVFGLTMVLLAVSMFHSPLWPCLLLFNTRIA